MDRLLAMEAFVAVVEAGSFVAASERLGRATSTTSRQVSELEAHLQARLFQRTTRRLTLTEQGQVFYRHCKDLLARLEEAEAEVGAGTGEPNGVLRVTAPVSFGTLHLAGLIPQFHARHPRVHLNLSLDDRQVDLMGEGHDLALRISRSLPEHLVARKLASVSIITCAAPGYLAQAGRPERPEALQAHTCLLYSQAEPYRTWTYQGPQGPIPVRVGGYLTANNGDVLRAAALAGDGIAQLPAFLVRDDLSAGRLVPLLPDYPLPPLGVYAVYPSRRYLPAKVRAFVDFLAETWRDTPTWEQGPAPD
ncbi:LysR substrate-binding domain-containing protein [Alkalilimnicola ehrlichii MLHE-1]|uniref:Transcriptional regulator, LysR family n=1 Tax=Alkalilimnicola ehrlichii (strain ATCC BAA-1101 / DSM 17681 / MLHE-1) TaxID=187272 RepID=Q0A8T5_ALKEH|nr:LysR family transcriptional regulator [Alkalilimnicola ehrlichii]ABI56752.1 transcriptional regulator, LysR family [Alkalilimnicola ehrlichii MLHE-1]